MFLQRLAFPLEFHGMCANMHIDLGRDLGTPNKDEVLLPDPAQAVLVMDIWADRELRILLVVRTQVLVKQTYSVRAGSPVPWDEWGRDAMAIEVQNDGGHRMLTFVHGAQVMIARASSLRGLGNYDVRTFGFSQRGRKSLPIRGEADAERRVLFEAGVNLKFEPDDGIGPQGELKPLSDGSLICLVSYLIPPEMKSLVDASAGGYRKPGSHSPGLGVALRMLFSYVLLICHERSVAATVPYK